MQASFWPEDSEESLICAARQGDQGAFRELFLRHEHEVYLRVRRSCGMTHDDAEDVLQEASLQAFGKLYQFEGRSSFRTWFTRIAINKAINRSRRREVCIDSDPDQLSNVSDPEVGPEQELLETERRAIVVEVINSLPPIYRKVIWLWDIDGRSLKEVAEILKIPENTAKKRHLKAKKLLGEACKRRGLTP
jgi:RNA polymerase sigma-70 factor (ECF subfamily)